MTLIAAVPDGQGGILLAADSGVGTDGGVIVLEQKLAFRSDRPLAWGFTGDGALGNDFNDWMAAAHLADGWSEVREAVVQQVARLNFARRERAVASGVNPQTLKSDQLLSVAVAGIVSEHAYMVAFDEFGGQEPLTGSVLCLGGGASLARVVLETLTALEMFDGTPEMFTRAMVAAVRMGSTLREPVRILRISQDGVTEC